MIYDIGYRIYEFYSTEIQLETPKIAKGKDRPDT